MTTSTIPADEDLCLIKKTLGDVNPELKKELALMSIEEKLDLVISLNYDMRKEYNAIVDDISFTTEELTDIFHVSEQTLWRWRVDKRIPYHVDPDGNCYYLFKELFVAVKSGQLRGKTLNRLQAIENLNQHFRGVMKGKIIYGGRKNG